MADLGGKLYGLFGDPADKEWLGFGKTGGGGEGGIISRQQGARG